MPSTAHPRAQRASTAAPPVVSGDERFVPASHVLVIDRQVSHPAFRLWCVLHRLWFPHEPPMMDVLQDLMGASITDKTTQAESWQPATRRSVERWLKPLQQSVHGIMRGPTRFIPLHTGGFSTRDHVRCGDQKHDVIEIGHFGCIHARMIPHNPSTA